MRYFIAQCLANGSSASGKENSQVGNHPAKVFQPFYYQIDDFPIYEGEELLRGNLGGW
jgi:hypothetical protein